MSEPGGPRRPGGRRPHDPSRLPPELDPRRAARHGGERPGGRHPQPPPGRGSGRRRAATVVRLLATALSVTVLVVSGVLWAGYHKYEGQIDRIDAIPSVGDSPKKDIDGKDMNILLVGNDSRDSATDAQLPELGTERDGGSSNTDTMILLHVPADGRRATLVSFPRDLWVDIPGLGKRKLNAAYPNGSKGGTSKEARAAGARLLIQTISGFSGLRIDHYVEVDLLGFYTITKAIGGVEVNLCRPAKDHYSGIDLPAGRQVIQGTQALAFVRQRHGLPGGDLDRIHRQQYFLGAVVRKMTTAGVLLNPVKLNRVLDAVTSSLHADPGFDPLKLAQQMRELAAGNVDFVTVPNKGSATVGGLSVVLPDEDKMSSFFATLGDGGGKPAGQKSGVSRGDVHVQVLNASGRSGLAARTSQELQDAGFSVGSPGNASAQGSTTIRYASDQAAAARTLAAVVPGATLSEDDSVGDTVQLVLGSDFDGLKSSGSGGGSGGGGGSGTSTAAGSTTAPDRTAADTGCIN
jgi:LCP family protein required for cell wall assembly